ncbi:hypothetical protein OUZ56_004718 [Daphnia magna]|uniref:Uncharacterized protein n=1 Tax=Daphnia magna TaxID=35525 RepID=A0ABQ9YQN5_9CRUS|nr:hypothetical protein OUZ56_004718 [Daphnia magna]
MEEKEKHHKEDHLARIVMHPPSNRLLGFSGVSVRDYRCVRGWINAHCCVDYRRNFCVPPKSTDVLSSLDPTSKARRPGQSTPNNG